jgi:hypothetical protein
MDAHHANETDSNARICLGDWCGALHCDFFAAAQRDSVSELRNLPCRPAAVEEHKRKCQDLAHLCFPPHAGATAERLYAFMLSSFCEAVTCRWRECVLWPYDTNGFEDSCATSPAGQLRWEHKCRCLCFPPHAGATVERHALLVLRSDHLPLIVLSVRVAQQCCCVCCAMCWAQFHVMGELIAALSTESFQHLLC